MSTYFDRPIAAVQSKVETANLLKLFPERFSNLFVSLHGAGTASTNICGPEALRKTHYKPTGPL